MTFPLLQVIMTIFVSAISILIALVVLFKDRKSASNIIFALLNFVISIWTIADFFTLNAPWEHRLFWIRIVMFLAVPQIFLLYTFIQTFPNQRFSFSKIPLLWIFGVTIFLMFISPTKLIFRDLVLIDNTQVATPGKLMPIYFVFTLYLFFASMIQLLKNAFKSYGLEKWQWRTIFFGFSIMFLLDISLLFITPTIFRNPFFIPFAPLFVVPFILATGFAILRYQFFKFKVVLRRSLVNGMLLSIVLALHLYLLLFVEEFLRGRFGFSSYGSSAVVVVIVAFSFPFLQRSCRWVVNRIFQSEEWDFSEKVDLIRSSLVNLKFLKDFAEEKVKELEQRFQISGVIFLLRDQRLQSTLSVYPSVGEIVLDDYDPFILCLLGLQGKVLDAGAFEQTWAEHPKEGNQEFRILHKFFKKNKVNLAIGFGPENSIAGGIMIPNRPRGYELPSQEAIESFAREVYSDLQALLRAQENSWGSQYRSLLGS